jgi:multidrug resistance efflux pump
MAVKIRRERPDQRRHHRVTAPLFVDVCGQRLRAADWSLGGLRLDGYPGPLPEVGTDLALQLTLPFQGFDVSFHAKAVVVRTGAEAAMIAVRFTEIGERERELMQHFIEELVRGSMVDIEDTIQRIDVPVTPASLQPDPSPVSQLPVRRWPVKTAVMTGIYVVLGLVVFGYAALLGYSNFYRMEVQTAVISAPVETVTAPGDGQVRWAGIKPGDHVKQGEVVLTLVDSQIQREIDLAEIAVQEKKARLNNLKRHHLEELERIRGYATVEMKNIRQTKVELESLAERIALAARNEERIKALHARGFATDQKLEEATRALITLRKEHEIRRIELGARIELSEQNLGKRMYTGNETIGSGDLQQGRLAEIEANIRLGEHEIHLAQQRQIATLAHRDRQSVRAPFEGTVLELPRFDSASVRRGDVIAIIEQRRARQITAYLNQDEVLRVGNGDEAVVYVPSLSEILKAKVVRIDRTSGFLREQDQRHAPGYNWRGPTDRSAKVTLEFAEPAKVADNEVYRSGLPVVVVFPQRSTNSFIASLRQKMSTAF